MANNPGYRLSNPIRICESCRTWLTMSAASTISITSARSTFSKVFAYASYVNGLRPAVKRVTEGQLANILGAKVSACNRHDRISTTATAACRFMSAAVCSESAFMVKTAKPVLPLAHSCVSWSWYEGCGQGGENAGDSSSCTHFSGLWEIFRPSTIIQTLYIKGIPRGCRDRTVTCSRGVSSVMTYWRRRNESLIERAQNDAPKKCYWLSTTVARQE